MEDAQVISKLDITLMEIKRNRVFLGSKVDGIQSLRLSFGQSRNIGRSLTIPVPSKVSARVLDDEALGISLGGRLVLKQGAERV